MNSDIILLPGKLTGLLVYVYNMQSLLERGNNCQNCAYCNRIFTANFTVFDGFLAGMDYDICQLWFFFLPSMSVY